MAIRIVTLVAVLLAAALHARADDKADISKQLDTLHASAATASWDSYFALYTEDAIFIGTDATERWDISTFKNYAAQAKNGWTYTVRERHIDLSPDGNSAWFDEILDSEKYGTSRGTGVLVKTPTGWKIAQYHLTFPVPNELAADVTAKIKAFETEAK